MKEKQNDKFGSQGFGSRAMNMPIDKLRERDEVQAKCSQWPLSMEFMGQFSLVLLYLRG